jgi:hypothetical protein
VCDVRSDARIAQTRHLSAIQEFCMLDESDRQLIRIFYAAMRFDAAGIRVTEDQRLMGAAARATLAKTSAGSLRLWDGWLAPLLAAAEKQLMEAGVEIPGPSPESVRLQAENEERRKVIAESQAYNAAIAEKARQDRCSGSSATFEKAEWQLLEKLGAVSFEAKAERFRELTFDEQCDVTLRVRKWQRELDEKAKDLDHRDAGVTGGTDRTAEVSQVAGSSRVTDTVESDVIASLGRKGAN